MRLLQRVDEGDNGHKRYDDEPLRAEHSPRVVFLAFSLLTTREKYLLPLCITMFLQSTLLITNNFAFRTHPKNRLLALMTRMITVSKHVGRMKGYHFQEIVMMKRMDKQ